MGNVDIVGLIFLTGFLIIPALGFTASLVMKPIVEAILQLRSGFAENPAALSEERMAALEAEVRDLNREVARLGEQVRFDHQLTVGSAPTGQS